MRKDYLKIKQTRAELKNKRREVKQLIATGQRVPDALIAKINNLKGRLQND